MRERMAEREGGEVLPAAEWRRPASAGRRRSPWSGRGRRGERGTVTAEVAMVLPMLMAIMLLGLWAVGVVVANIRCIDAARDVARAVARGEPMESAQRIGERAGPLDAVITISRDASDVHVVVSAELNLDWAILDGLPPIPVEGQATVQVEPGVQSGDGRGGSS